MSESQAPNNIITQTSVDSQEIRSPTLPLSLGKTPVSRLSKLYEILLKDKLGIKPTIVYGKVGGIFKLLLKQDTEISIAVLLIAHFNYNSESNRWFAEQIRERGYPIELFQTNINLYKLYLKDVKSIDYSDVDNVEDIVYRIIGKLI